MTSIPVDPCDPTAEHRKVINETLTNEVNCLTIPSGEGDFHCSEVLEDEPFLVKCPTSQDIKRKHEEDLTLPSQTSQTSVASTTAIKKLSREFARISKTPPPGITVKLSDDSNLFEWEALMVGPSESPFGGGSFRLRVAFPQDYPTSPPKVWFFTEMFHPNVFAEDGRVCIDILQNVEKWKPEYGIETVLVAVQILLGEPNPLSPANVEAGDLYQTDIPEYSRRVKRIVHRSESYRKLSIEESKLNYNIVPKTSQLACVVQ